MAVYKTVSDATSRSFADQCSVSRPVANRPLLLAVLASGWHEYGVEPIFAVAYTRYLRGSDRWHYQYVGQCRAKLIDRYADRRGRVNTRLAEPERRIKFQADVQDYVDMSISSTINLPAWGSDLNNEDTVEPFAIMLARYAHRLRGFTYADGSRGGHPAVPYGEASNRQGESCGDPDICDITGHGGSCGV